MAVKRCIASINVVDAAKRRIKNVFRNGLPVYMSFSGGKDSLCLAQLVVDLIQSGDINPAQLTVQFIDEEAIFPCIERTVRQWRNKFLLLGSKFEWYCLEVRHYNCFNELTNDESFICWDSQKKNVWVRNMPSFARTSHEKLKPRTDTYQDFISRVCADGITLVGVRTAESIQRLKYFARMMQTGRKISHRLQIFPIYDWGNSDVWLYLKEKKVEIPEIYLYLWQSGLSKNALRVSQFFSIDTARSLVKMNEYYPDLMERIIRREPNAYLASLYWDSEMFGRHTQNRKKLEAAVSEKDYKAELLTIFSHPEKGMSKHKLSVWKRYRNLFLQTHSISTQKDYKEMYEAYMKGDPKLRTCRALYQHIYGRYVDTAKVNMKEGVKNGRQ